MTALQNPSSGSGSHDPLERHCTFWLAGQRYGLPISVVREILARQPVTPVPAGGAIIHGLINLRGDIVTVLDLRQRLELQPRPSDELAMNIVVAMGTEIVSLLVDDVGEVVDLSAGSVVPVPSTVAPLVRELMTEVHRLDDGLVQLLDASRLVAPSGV